MKTPVNPVSPKQSKDFDALIVKWQQKLNLSDWRIVRSKRKTANMSDIKPLVAHRLATYTLGTDFGGTLVDDYSLEQTAVHELLHVLLADLTEVAATPGYTQDQLMAAEHRVIHTLLTLLVPRQ